MTKVGDIAREPTEHEVETLATMMQELTIAQVLDLMSTICKATHENKTNGPKTNEVLGSIIGVLDACEDTVHKMEKLAAIAAAVDGNTGKDIGVLKGGVSEDLEDQGPTIH